MNGLIASLFQTTEKRAVDIGGVQIYAELLEKSRESGISVTPSSSLQMAAVYACVRILAETVASLPLFIYERQERGRRRAQDFYLYKLLHDQPNPEMTAFEYRETIQGHLALWGNAYSQVTYNERGQVQELWPLRPDHILQSKMQGGLRYYQYMTANGAMDWYSEDEIWHLRGLGSDGLDGYSPIGLMRKAVGLGLSAEEFGARFFENDARPGIVLEHPAKLSEQAHKNLTGSWEDRHQGARKSHKPAILEEGMKLHEIGIPPEDAQFLETRKFQVQEIARMFRIPPHMLADLERATFSNIEHQSIEFVMHTIRPWLVRWEQSIDKNLMLGSERERFYAEHLVDGLLRGDITSRYQAYAMARQNGWMSANDIRELENMNPVDGGDVYLVPLNMVPADQAGAVSDQPSVDSDRKTEEKSINHERHEIHEKEQGEEREERVKKAANVRHRLMRSYRRLFKDTATRVIRRESNDIRAAGKKYLNKRDLVQFKIWLQNFYQEHVDFAMRQFMPLMLAYGEVVSEEAAQEINFGGDYRDRIDRFVRSYTTAYSSRHSLRSLARMQTRLDAAQAADEDLEAAMDDELNQWMEIRTEEIASEESVRLNNAAAVTLYEIATWATLRSVAFGENCPYCDDLDGRVIGITENFLEAGDYQPKGADRPLVVEMPMRHAPYHGGCDCMTVAG